MISYMRLYDAVRYYTDHGFLRIDVPWIVTQAAIDITRPADAKTTTIEDGALVASGEQGFLQLLLDGRLPPGRWQCATPCFRFDPIDRYHQRYFMKVELIDTRDVTIASLEEMTDICLGFFRSKLPGCYVLETNPEDPILLANTGRDILSPRGVELGSYGIRNHPAVGHWVYATGCAEPRLSLAIEDSCASN